MEPIEIKEVCRYFGTTYSEAKQEKKVRKNEVILVRYYCFLFLKERTKLSLEQIGRFFDKNHATVLNGLKKIAYWIEIDIEKKHIYDAIKFKLDLYDEIDNNRSHYFITRIKRRSLKNPTLKKTVKRIVY